MRWFGDRRRGAALALVGAFAALVLAWAYGSPTGTGPDESQHLTKALAAGHGEISGTGVRHAPPDRTRIYWLSLTTRLFRTPGPLADRQKAPCMAFHPQQPAGCPAVPVRDQSGPAGSYVGSYQPFLYVPVGLLADRAHSPGQAYRLARLAGAAMCLVLLALGTFAALEVTPAEVGTAVTGLLVALPPMAFFLFSVVNPNGPEIAAGVCFAAGLMAVARKPASRLGWITVAVGGAVLGCARSLGPFWLVFGIALLVADRGRSWLRRLPVGAVLPVAGVLLCSALACSLWEITRQPHLPVSVGTVVHNVPTALSEWTAMLRQTVGVFGWTDTPLPTVAYVGAWLVALTLGTAALVAGNRRERCVLVCAAAALALASVLLSAGVLHREGWAMQARYMLPPAALLPIYAAEVLRRHARGAGLVRLVLPVAAALQLLAWLVNARRYAVGVDGPVMFLTHSRWHPSGGWGPWLILAIGGSALLLTVVRAHRPTHDDGGRAVPGPPAALRVRSPISS